MIKPGRGSGSLSRMASLCPCLPRSFEYLRRSYHALTTTELFLQPSDSAPSCLSCLSFLLCNCRVKGATATLLPLMRGCHQTTEVNSSNPIHSLFTQRTMLPNQHCYLNIGLQDGEKHTQPPNCRYSFRWTGRS